MRKLSFWNRRCVNVTSASMLTAVLLLSGCAANRESRTAVRSGSLQRSVTGEIIFGKAPTTLTSLALKPGLLRTIGGLPAGMGVTEQHEGLDLRVESDGEGGVNVTAVSHARPEITVRGDLGYEVGVRGGYGRGKTAGSLFLGPDKDEGVVLFCPPASLLGTPAV